MSERKTDEIKFRVEPSVKARWQAAADREQLGLSEWIRRAAERDEAQPILLLDTDTSKFTTLLSGPPTTRVIPNGAPSVVTKSTRDWRPFGA